MTRVIGIDIGHAHVKIAHIQYLSGDRQILGLHSIPRVSSISPGLQLKEFFQQHSLPADRIVVGEGSSNILFRRYLFPFSDNKRASSAAYADFEDSLPFPIDQFIFDLKLLQKKSKANIFIAGLLDPAQLLELSTRVEKEAELHPHAYYFDSEALAQMALSQNLPASQAPQPYILIDLGEETTKIALIRGSRPKDLDKKASDNPISPDILELRILNKGFQDVVKNLAHQRQQTAEDALKFLLEKGEILESEGSESDEIKNASRVLVVELFQTLQHFRSKYAHDLASSNFSGIYLCGAYSSIKGIREFFSHELRCPCFNWPAEIGFSNGEAYKNELKNYTLALALAFRFTLPKAQGWLNFKKGTNEKRKVLSHFIRSLLSQDLKVPRLIYLNLLSFLVFYVVIVSIAVERQKLNAEKYVVSEFKKFDPNLGIKATNFVKDVSRARELFEQNKKKNSIGSSTKLQVVQEQPRLSYLLELGEDLAPDTLIKSMEIRPQGFNATVELKNEIAQTTDFERTKSQMQESLKKKGYSQISLLQIDKKQMKISAIKEFKK